MQLLTQTNYGIEKLTERTETGNRLYIEGTFLMSETRNRNGRIYPKAVMEAAVDKYQREYVSERRAIGELNHPDRPFADPAEAAIMIESLTWQGNNVVGKARVLDTPKGAIIRGLLDADFNLGVSSRGLGDTKTMNGTAFVSNFMLNAIDAVDLPSGQECYVNAVNESVEWIMESGVWVPKQVAVQKPVTAEELSEAFADFFRGLRKHA